MNDLFKFHKLNEEGQDKGRAIARDFSELVAALENVVDVNSREWAIAKTKLEEAAFFTKKSMAIVKGNQE